jgi:hypothetical protein
MLRIDTTRAAKGFEAALAEIDRLAEALGAKYSLQIATSTEVSARLAYFTEGTATAPARPLFEYNDVARDRVETAMRRTIATTGRVNVLVSLQAGAQALRALFVERLEAGGGDVAFDALTPDYARQKARKGQPAVPGVASGRMRDELRAGLVVVRKVG